MMRLQGIVPNSLHVNVAPLAFRKCLGNAMSLNVLQRLLVSLLPSAGLVEPGQLHDPWLTGAAQSELSATRELSTTRQPAKRARKERE